jgi:hypothetical protein
VRVFPSSPTLLPTAFANMSVPLQRWASRPRRTARSSQIPRRGGRCRWCVLPCCDMCARAVSVSRRGVKGQVHFVHFVNCCIEMRVFGLGSSRSRILLRRRPSTAAHTFCRCVLAFRSPQMPSRPTKRLEAILTNCSPLAMDLLRKVGVNARTRRRMDGEAACGVHARGGCMAFLPCSCFGAAPRSPSQALSRSGPPPL